MIGVSSGAESRLFTIIFGISVSFSGVFVTGTTSSFMVLLNSKAAVVDNIVVFTESVVFESGVDEAAGLDGEVLALYVGK